MSLCVCIYKCVWVYVYCISLLLCVCVGRWEAVSVVACVYVYKCIKHTEQIGPKAKKKKMLCFNCLWFCGGVEGNSSLEPQRQWEWEKERDRETKARSKEWVEQELQKEGDKILITMFCIHSNLCVSCISSKVLAKAEVIYIYKQSEISFKNTKQSAFFKAVKSLWWAVARGAER